MIRTTSPETAEAQRLADSPPAGDVEGGLGDVTLTVVAAVLPFLFALYAILTAGKALGASWKFALVGGTAGLYSLALVGLGVLLARAPARALAGRTLVVCGGLLAAMLASAGWFISGQGILPLVLLNAAGAAALALVAAAVHARLTGERPVGALILAAAVLLLGLSGGRNVVVPRANMMVLDAAAALLACGVFVRPGRVVQPLGRVALALSVPLAALLLRPLWETTRLPELGGFVVGLIWALRVIRPRLYHGSVGLLAAALTAAVLVTALPTLPSRHLLAALALAALMLLDHDLRQDPDAGPLDRVLPGWAAGAVWLVLAGTWAHDLRLLERGLGLPRGFPLESLPWVGLLALPLALPAFALSRRRLASAPADVEPDPDALPAGTAAEVLGWLVVAGGLIVALLPAVRTGIGWVSVGTLAAAAVVIQGWSRIRASPGRLTVAHLLLIAAVWAAALRTGRPILALAPLAVAVALAAAPLLGGRRTTGLVGGILLPLLAFEALARHTSVWTDVQGAWSADWVGRGVRLALGALAAVGAWFSVRMAGRRRRLAAAGLEPPAEQAAPPAPLDAPDAGLGFEAVGWALLGVAGALAVLPFPIVDPGSLVLLLGITAISAAWTPLGGSAGAAIAASLLLVLDVWLAGRWLGTGAPALAAPATALLLSLAPLASRSFPRAAPRAGWVGFLLFPLTLTDALIARQGPVLPSAGLLAVFGLLHLAAPPQAPAWTRAAGVPGVLVAGYLLVAGITGATWGTPPLQPALLVPVLAGALAAMALWAAFASGPVVIGLEALLGSIAFLLVTASPLALLPLLLLAAGRQPLLARAAALALVTTGAAVATLSPLRLPVEAAAAALAAGGAGLFRSTPPFAGSQADMSALEVTLESLRRAGPAAMAAGVLVLLLVPGTDGRAWLPETTWPAAAAAVVVVTAIGVRVHARPSFLAAQTVAAALMVAAGATALALLRPAAGNLAPVAALVSLAAAMIAAGRLSAETATVIWGIAALAAPLAVIPLAGGPFRWPVALLAAVEVILLGAAARRQISAILATWTLWLGLLVAIWLAVAVLARLSAAGDPALYTAAAALGAALAGGLALAGGSGWLGAPASFIQPFIHTCLWLGAAAAILAAGIGPVGTPREVAVTMLALVAVAGVALAMALRHSAGFPWLIAGGVLAAGYACLRLRTSWMGLLAAADGLVAVGAALLATLAERRLRPRDPEPPPGAIAPAAPDPRLPPDDFPVPRAPGERELGWLATGLAGASVVPVFQGLIPIHWAALGPLLGSLLLLVRARRDGPAQALAAAALFNTTIAVALDRFQIGNYAAYALPIGGSLAVWVQVYRDRLGFDAGARAVPALAVGGVCALQLFQTPGLLPAAALAAAGLLMLPASRVWRERSYLWIGLGCVATAAVALVWFTRGEGEASDLLARLSMVSALRALPVLALLVVTISALLLARSDRWVEGPLAILHARVGVGLGLAAALATAALIFAPVRGPLDVALALASVAATVALALRLAPRLPAGWLVVLAGAGPVGAYAYLRLRSGWMDDWQDLDGGVAVAGGFALVLVERLLRGAGPVPVQPAAPDAEEDPERWPFGVREVRILATAITCLSAVAFLHRQSPAHAVAPLLAVLLFLLRMRAGHPIHGVLAVLYLNATVALYLWDRNVTAAAAYALPPAASLTLLLHVYRGHLGSDEAVVRSLPAIAAAGACIYDAVTGPSVLTATVQLAAIGFVLLLLARRWQMRPYLAVGLGCVGAALLTTITEWNARGWTASAVAIGTATLLVPAVLLRRR